MSIDLEAIKARAEVATPGPWCADEEFVMHPDKGVDTFDGTIIAKIVDHDAGMFPIEHNREFIAHAREDIPALIAEVERLRGIVERVRLARSNYPPIPACDKYTLSDTISCGWKSAIESIDRALAGPQ